MNNQRGSSLITVLLVVVIFMTLGLSIITASIQGARLTQFRVNDVDATTKHEKIMAEIIATIHNNIKKNEFLGLSTLNFEEFESPNDLLSKGIVYDNALETMLNNILLDFKNKYSMKNTPKCVPVTGEYISDFDSNSDKYFTRVYELQIEVEEESAGGLPTITKSMKQRIILSPTPSFFQYAIGAYGKKPNTNENISENALIINGSPDIIGNTYAPSLKLYNKAFYYIKVGANIKEERSSDFVGPAIFGNAFVDKINDQKLIDYIKAPSPVTTDFFKGVFPEDITGIPLLKPTGNNFVDMNFDNTYDKKREQNNTFDRSSLLTDCASSSQLFRLLGKVGYLGPERSNHIPTPEVDGAGNPTGAFKDYMDTIDTLSTLESKPYFICTRDVDFYNNFDNFYLLEADWSTDALNPPDSTISSSDDKVIYYGDVLTDSSGDADDIKLDSDPNNMPTLTIDQDLDVGDNGWLVVDGNLEIIGSHSNPPKINGNIMVEGNLSIEGDPSETNSTVFFNSTVYVNGESTVYNTNIEGICKNASNNCSGTNQNDLKQLILISRGDLDISRINEFKDTPTYSSLINKVESLPNLKAYFYTESNAELYGVGSLFEIEGGVFARRQLTINAIRDNTVGFSEAKLKSSSGTTYKSPDDEDRNSRFSVEYDPNVLYSRLSSLPRVNRLQMIVDDLIIEEL